MKNRKSKRRAQEESPYSKGICSSTSARFNIKFELSSSNLSCFIGQKRQNKKTLPKRSQSDKKRKVSQKKNPMITIKQEQVKQKQEDRKRVQQSPDIIRESSNSILNKIQSKGIKYEWKYQETKQIQNNQEQVIKNDIQQVNQNEQIWSVFSMTSSLQKSVLKSYASTMDYQQPMYYHSMEYNVQTLSPYQQNLITYHTKINSSYDNFQVRAENIGYDPRTTIMIRNIPNKYTIKDLAEQIDFYFANTYDFLYLPCDFKNNCNVGYGFINFISTNYLHDFYIEFHNKRWGKFRSQKICILTYARLQGLNSLIQHFQNSKVLNSKQKRYRPIIRRNAKIDDLIKTQQQQ